MSDWSEAEDHKLLKMWCVYNPSMSIRAIADDLERGKSSVDRRLVHLGLKGHKGEVAMYEKIMGVSLDPVIRPVLVAVPVREEIPVKPVTNTTVVWGDVHFPFQDDATLDILRQITAELRPDTLVCLGDVYDFWEMSEHRSPADLEPDLQATINAGSAHLAEMKDISGATKCIFMQGNHEDRWDRMLDKARKDIRFRALLQLPKIRRSLDFAEVVGFKDLGYEYEPYMEGKPFIEHDRLLYTHGHFTNKHVALTTMAKYGKSVVFGHMHRIQNHTKRDLKGQEAGWCIGCLCTLDPHYDVFADWHQGFAVVSWHKIEGEWIYNVEQVRIHDGTAIFRDRVYNAS